MKIHYIDILLFALPLNILVNNQRNHNSSTYHTSNTKTITTHRSLCECELYSPSNFEYDTEMNDVIKKFNDRTLQRFEEYNERMQDKRKQCKEQCEKDIQKIILKDKIEKELTEKFATLGTNIDTNDIPTCVCEKSLADKTEKVCLNCGKTMGAVAPAWGLVSGLGYAAWINYTNTTLVKIATDAGIAEGVNVGLIKVAEIVKQISGASTRIPVIDGAKLITAGKFTEKISLYDIGKTIDSTMAIKLEAEGYSDYCFTLQSVVKPNMLKTFPQHAAAIETAFNEAQTGVLTEGASTTSSLTTAITTSIVAIVIIILVVIIIYLILRYRRKKKMKKKLQYIKLLKE